MSSLSAIHPHEMFFNDMEKIFRLVFVFVFFSKVHRKISEGREGTGRARNNILNWLEAWGAKPSK